MTAGAGLRAQSLDQLIDQFGGRAVGLAFSKDPNAKITILLFAPDGVYPKRVAKVPTTAEAATSVAREAVTLGRLDAASMGAIGVTIPRLVEVAEHSGLPVMVTRGLPGTAMLIHYHSWRHTSRPASVAKDLDMAGAWLAEFQERTAGDEADLADMVDGVSSALRRRFDGDPMLHSDLAQMADLEARLSGPQVARTVVHGDFWLGNVLVDHGRVSGVVDWERARDDGLPVHDLARFAIAYSLYLDRHTPKGRRVAGHPGLRADRWGAGIDHAVDGTGWYPDLFRQYMVNGLSRLGLSPAVWRDVVLAELLVMAAEADHLGFAREHLLVFRRLSRSGAR